MQITSEDLRERFNDAWPDLTQIWLRNKSYIVPTLEQLTEVVNQYIVEMPTIKGFNECENFALYLHSSVKMHRAKMDLEKEEQLNWAFGDFICQKDTLFEVVVVHTACICLCDSGFYIIEPLERNKVLKQNEDYRPFFVNLM